MPALKKGLSGLEPDELEALTSGFELEARSGDVPVDYNQELARVIYYQGAGLVRAYEYRHHEVV